MRACSLRGPWLAMATAAGGVAELAASLGFQRNAVYKWAHGRSTPHPTIQAHVNAWAKRRQLREPFKLATA